MAIVISLIYQSEDWKNSRRNGVSIYNRGVQIIKVLCKLKSVEIVLTTRRLFTLRTFSTKD